MKKMSFNEFEKYHSKIDGLNIKELYNIYNQYSEQELIDYPSKRKIKKVFEILQMDNLCLQSHMHMYLDESGSSFNAFFM